MSGESFKGADELTAVLLKKKREEFVRCLSEKMLTYALGRGVELRDRAAVRRIVDRVQANGYRMQELILGVVESEPFRKRRSERAGL